MEPYKTEVHTNMTTIISQEIKNEADKLNKNDQRNVSQLKKMVVHMQE